MRAMWNRKFKNKYISILSLVAFLFATTCFVPCGASRVDASPRHAENGMQYEVKGHSCHSESAENSVKAAKSEDSCPHCKVIQSAALQERGSRVDHTQAPIVAFSASSFVTQYFSPLELVDKSSPPGSYRPIYILNSTFII